MANNEHERTDAMNNRKRFRRIMNYEPVDRLPVLAVEPFETMAIERRRKKGLPGDIHPADYLGMSKLVHIPLSFDPIPPFERQVVSEDAEYVVETTNMGALVRRRKDNPTMFYGHIDHPVKTRADWEAYKLRFQASTPGRLPEDWLRTVVPSLNDSPDPVALFLFPFSSG